MGKISIRFQNKGLPILGGNVNVGANVVIIGNITTGNNVLIGAGSVVTKIIPDNSVVGNTARVIRNLVKISDV